MNDFTNGMIGCFALICIILVIFGLSFLLVAGLTYLVCLAFDIAWSWLLALGVYALIVLIGMAIK